MNFWRKFYLEMWNLVDMSIMSGPTKKKSHEPVPRKNRRPFTSVAPSGRRIQSEASWTSNMPFGVGSVIWASVLFYKIIQTVLFCIIKFCRATIKSQDRNTANFDLKWFVLVQCHPSEFLCRELSPISNFSSSSNLVHVTITRRSTKKCQVSMSEKKQKVSHLG